LAIEARYQKIVFCGIDMNTDYFYFHKNYLTDKDRENLTRERHLNKHSKDSFLEGLVLEYLQKVDSMSDIEIYSFKGNNPLKRVLKHYSISDD